MIVSATVRTGSRLFAWARGAAIVTILANVALFVSVFALAPSGEEVAAHPNVIWSNTFAVFLLAPLTGVAFLLAVVLMMEYRVRSLGSADPCRGKKLNQLVLLLAPTAFQLVVLLAFVVYALMP